MTKTDVNAVARTHHGNFHCWYLGRSHEMELLIEAGADPNPPTANDGSEAGKLRYDMTRHCGAIAKGIPLSCDC